MNESCHIKPLFLLFFSFSVFILDDRNEVLSQNVRRFTFIFQLCDKAFVTTFAPSGRAHFSWPERSRSIHLYTIVKYFLFERTGVAALQIDPGHDKNARPVECP